MRTSGMEPAQWWGSGEHRVVGPEALQGGGGQAPAGSPTARPARGLASCSQSRAARGQWWARGHALQSPHAPLQHSDSWPWPCSSSTVQAGPISLQSRRCRNPGPGDGCPDAHGLVAPSLRKSWASKVYGLAPNRCLILGKLPAPPGSGSSHSCPPVPGAFWV